MTKLHLVPGPNGPAPRRPSPPGETPPARVAGVMFAATVLVIASVALAWVLGPIESHWWPAMIVALGVVVFGDLHVLVLLWTERQGRARSAQQHHDHGGRAQR